jgi:hypothetical protein
MHIVKKSMFKFYVSKEISWKLLPIIIIIVVVIFYIYMYILFVIFRSIEVTSGVILV